MAATAQLERTEDGWTGVQPDAAWMRPARSRAVKEAKAATTTDKATNLRS